MSFTVMVADPTNCIRTASDDMTAFLRVDARDVLQISQDDFVNPSSSFEFIRSQVVFDDLFLQQKDTARIRTAVLINYYRLISIETKKL